MPKPGTLTMKIGTAIRTREAGPGWTLGASVIALAVVLCAAPLCSSVAAQQKIPKSGQLPRIGYLVPGPPRCESPGDAWLGIVAAFLDGLKQGGFVPGQNAQWQPQCFQADTMVPDIVADLLRQGPDVIVVNGTPAALAAQRQTKTIPIVFGGVGDPVGSGIVPNLTRPGGNVTGISNIQRELAQKRIELLRETVPRLRRVAVLIDPIVDRSAPSFWAETENAAGAMAISLERFEASSREEIDELFPRIVASGVQALLVVPGQLTWVERPRIFRLALAHRLPSIGQSGVEYGALMSYDSSLREVYRNVGRYVARILKGEKPAELPVQQPTTFELELNLKTAHVLGLTIPPSLLLRATRVIDR